MTTRARPYAALAVLGTGAALAPLDFAVNVAFPAITEAFALPTQAIRWVAVCYVLTTGALMLAAGALGDRVGHLRVFRAGLWTALVAFVACALAPGYGWLLVARVLQGVAAALLLACAPALATQLVAEDQRTWALSALAATAAFATLLAPVAGGLALAWIGWPGVFAFRAPLAMAVLLALPWLSRRLRAAPRATTAFDAPASVLLTATVAVLLLVPALLAPDLGAMPAAIALLAGLPLLAVLVRRQRASVAPLLPREAALGWPFATMIVTACVVHTATFALPLIVPYALLRVGDWTPAAAGPVLSAWAAGALLGAAVAPRAIAAWGATRTAHGSALLGAAGLASIAAWPADPGMTVMLASLLLQGAGSGLFQVAYTDRVVAALPPEARGVAGAFANVTRTVGVVLGATLWTGMLQAFEDDAATGEAARQALARAISAVFTVAAAIILAWYTAGALLRRAGAHR